MDKSRPVKYYMVDAFTDQAYKGNPAAVCFLEDDIPDKWLQSVAMEFNISIACFLRRIAGDTASSVPRFHLRWFTPVTEVPLCGHATVAAAHTIFTHLLVGAGIVEFVTLSGLLTVKKICSSQSQSHNSAAEKGFFIEIDFPAVETHELNSAALSSLEKTLGCSTILDRRKTATVEDILVVLPSLKDVLEIKPNQNELLKLPGRGVIVTAKADLESGFDFCSRFFAPKYGIPEDPVCGTAHCSLVTYWSEKLGKRDFTAYAASSRGGVLHLHLEDDDRRVMIRGKAIIVMEGLILV